VGGLTKSAEDLVAAAEAEVTTLSIEQTIAALDAGALLVDVRDVREVEREGKIPGSYHAPRGMLEFWFDPASSYHRTTLSSAEQIVLYCNLGWRSALAAKTLQDMGMTNVAHVGGGFTQWKAEHGPVERTQPR
jgi:rhodanese-related sulfurtransferase